MTNYGIRVINKDERCLGKLEEILMNEKELASFKVDPSVVAVVCGVDMTFNYRKLCIATLYLQINNAKFIATNRDRVYPTPHLAKHMPAGGSVV